jgi:hypothetical protein
VSQESDNASLLFEYTDDDGDWIEVRRAIIPSVVASIQVGDCQDEASNGLKPSFCILIGLDEAIEHRQALGRLIQDHSRRKDA